MRSTVRILIPLLALSFSMASIAHAGRITYEFSGTLTSTWDGPASFCCPVHNPGDPFSGTIEYDLEAHRQWIIDYAAAGRFTTYATYVSATLNIGNFSRGSNFALGIGQNTDDNLNLNASGTWFRSITLFFAPGVLSPPTVLPGFWTGELPTSLSPGDFLHGRFRSDVNEVHGDIAELRVVPEPSTLILLSAAAGLAWVRRYKRRQRVSPAKSPA
jgi:hypothetical protein